MINVSDLQANRELRADAGAPRQGASPETRPPRSTSWAEPPVHGTGLKRMKFVHSPLKAPAALDSSGSGWCRPADVETGGRPACSQLAAEATTQPALSNTSSHSTRSTFCSVLRHSHVPETCTMNCLLHPAPASLRRHAAAGTAPREPPAACE